VSPGFFLVAANDLLRRRRRDSRRTDNGRTVPQLVDVAVAPPPYVVDQARVAAFARERFEGLRHLDRLMPIFANAGIETRRLCRPPEWYVHDHPLDERSAAYIEVATDLCARAARDLFARQGLGPADIDRVIYVNTTGLATPSIDARLINVLGLGRHVRRTPVWGLGCAGGVAGLSLAVHDLLGHPRERALVFAAEMCTLTFLFDDRSTSNLVATALFADGAGVALVSGDETGDRGYPIVGTRSTFFPDSLEIMGWNVVARGLQVVFDQRIPSIVTKHAAGELEGLLADHQLDRSALREFLYHPGGPKVLQAYADAYGVGLEAFGWSRDVLAEFGNMSSVTVLYVLGRYLAAHPPGRSGYAAVSALGPGFSSESLLLKL
jgi:alkylresorcinol/alkylpyrone synthase